VEWSGVEIANAISWLEALVSVGRSAKVIQPITFDLCRIRPSRILRMMSVAQGIYWKEVKVR
jgi:hypothetical protein